MFESELITELYKTEMLLSDYFTPKFGVRFERMQRQGEISLIMSRLCSLPNTKRVVNIGVDRGRSLIAQAIFLHKTKPSDGDVMIYAVDFFREDFFYEGKDFIKGLKERLVTFFDSMVNKTVHRNHISEIVSRLKQDITDLYFENACGVRKEFYEFSREETFDYLLAECQKIFGIDFKSVIKKCSMMSDEFFDNFSNITGSSVADVILVDGAHSYEQCKKDIINAVKTTRIGGFIVVHDYVYDTSHAGVAKAVDETLKGDKSLEAIADLSPPESTLITFRKERD